MSCPRPAAITGLKCQIFMDSGPRAMYLTFDEVPIGATSIHGQYQGGGRWTRGAVEPPTVTSITISYSAATVPGEVSFRVRARNRAGFGPWSNVAIAYVVT
jgi:hypothetical protein